MNQQIVFTELDEGLEAYVRYAYKQDPTEERRVASD